MGGLTEIRTKLLFSYREEYRLSVGTGVFLRGVNPPEREVDHSTPSSIQVKNEWNSTSPPPVHAISWRGQGQLYLYISHMPRVAENVMTGKVSLTECSRGTTQNLPIWS